MENQHVLLCLEIAVIVYMYRQTSIWHLEDKIKALKSSAASPTSDIEVIEYFGTRIKELDAYYRKLPAFLSKKRMKLLPLMQEIESALILGMADGIITAIEQEHYIREPQEKEKILLHNTIFHSTVCYKEHGYHTSRTAIFKTSFFESFKKRSYNIQPIFVCAQSQIQTDKMMETKGSSGFHYWTQMLDFRPENVN